MATNPRQLNMPLEQGLALLVTKISSLGQIEIRIDFDNPQIFMRGGVSLMEPDPRKGGAFMLTYDSVKVRRRIIKPKDENNDGQ